MIRHDQIIQENFDCDSDDKLILQGTIKREVKEINHPCKGPSNQLYDFHFLATKFKAYKFTKTLLKLRLCRLNIWKINLCVLTIVLN